MTAVSWPAWPTADERGLARYVTADAGRLLALDVETLDQPNTPEGRRALVEAIYTALVRRDIRYGWEQFHPSHKLQNIRAPQTVLQDARIGTCLDLAALFCGVCLHYELLPVLIWIRGHALAAVSMARGLRDRNVNTLAREIFSSGPLRHANALSSLVSSGELLPVECTGFAKSGWLARHARPDAPETVGRPAGVMTFERAIAAGREQLSHLGRPFDFALDIATAHFDWRIEPHPTQVPTTIGSFSTLHAAPPTLAKQIRALDFEHVIHARTPDFVGREFVFDEIDRALRDSSLLSGFILITGAPGIGKTALLSELVKRRGYVHHFNVETANIRSTRLFLENICSQLIVRYKLPYVTLPAEATNDSAFLVQLLSEATVRTPAEPIVVVVDALDEAEDVGLSAAANRLYLPTTLPKGVFFVMTSRNVKDLRLHVDVLHRIRLQEADERNVADVRRYVKTFINSHQPRMEQRIAAWGLDTIAFISLLVMKSEGNFMYLVHVLRDIYVGVLSKATLDNVQDLPHGLREYYQRHWRTMRDHDSAQFERIYEPVLRMLAVVRQPVPLDKLKEWTQLSTRDIKRVIDDWYQFVIESYSAQGDPLYRLYHASFQEFLAVEGIGLRPFHQRIAEVALEKIPGFRPPQEQPSLPKDS